MTSPKEMLGRHHNLATIKPAVDGRYHLARAAYFKPAREIMNISEIIIEAILKVILLAELVWLFVFIYTLK